MSLIDLSYSFLLNSGVKYSRLVHSWLMWLREYPQMQVSLLCKMYWKCPLAKMVSSFVHREGQGYNCSLLKFVWSVWARLISVSDDGECSISIMGCSFSDTQGINLISLGPYRSQRWDNLYLERKTKHFLMQPVIGILLLLQEKGWVLLRVGFLCKLQSRTIWVDLRCCFSSQSPHWTLLHW